VAVTAATNRLVGYTYDANGNVANIPGVGNIGYDAANRVSGAAGEMYLYGPENLRMYRRKSDGTEELHVYGERQDLFRSSTHGAMDAPALARVIEVCMEGYKRDALDSVIRANFEQHGQQVRQNSGDNRKSDSPWRSSIDICGITGNWLQ